jgi:CheY-like chemotaxis protein
MTPAKTILVVDDDSDIREMYAMLFMARGYGVVRANNGEDALDRLAKQEIHAIVLDLMMPRMSGYEVVEHLRSDGLLDRYPTVILTARQADDIDQDRLRGVRRVFQKASVNLTRFIDEFQAVTGA